MLSDEYVRQEIADEFAGKYLFDKFEQIKGLAQSKPGVFKRFRQAISGWMQRVNSDSRIAQLIYSDMKRARDLYAQAAKEVGAAKTGAETSGDNKRYSLRDGAADDVEKALNDTGYRDDVYLTESSPSVMLNQKGVRNLPMLMKASHIRENVFTESEAEKRGLKVDKNINYHGLGKTLFLQIIDGLDDVTRAYRGTKNANNPTRRENYFLLISQYKDNNGETINVPVYINEHGQYNRVLLDTNKIATVFGKENFEDYIRREVKNGNLVRIKKKNTQASERTAPIAAGYSKSVSADSISQSGAESQGLSENSSDEKRHSYEDNVDKIYLSAVETGDTVMAANLVKAAAKRAGYDSPLLYHGTKNFGFTEIFIFSLNVLTSLRNCDRLFLRDLFVILPTPAGWAITDSKSLFSTS